MRTGGLGQVFLILFALMVGIPALAGLYIDMRWFEALGHGAIFTTILGTKVAIGMAVGLFVGGFLAGNLRLAHRSSAGLAPLYLHDPDGVPRVDLGEVVGRLAWPVSILIGVLSGLFNYRHWETWLLHQHGAQFGVTDPVFGRDVGFYVFDLPLMSSAASIAMWTLGVSAAGATGMYVARGAIAMGEGPGTFEPAAKRHLSALGAAILALLAFEAYLDMFDVMYSDTGRVMGASYADVNARLPALRIKVGVAAVGALLVLASATREGVGMAVLAGVLYIAAQLGAQLVPDLVHRFSVLPNEFEREAPYLKHNIDATRRAYGLDAVVERELSADDSLERADIENNAATIDNVRLWDHQPLLDTFAQIQEIRPYYQFASVDNDRYVIDGQLRQTMLSPRELPLEGVPRDTWIAKRMVYTHGYGLTLGPVNETTPEGLPVLFVKDMPPVSSTESIRVTRSSIYFGEIVGDHVFVRTRNGEFHYPKEEGYVETEYDGAAGIRFDSGLMRAALAIHLGELKVLLTDDIDSDSRVLLHRNIRDRLSTVAPFLELDPDPYMVVRGDGTLAWIFDAYTATHRYPYAERSRSRINYVRNSVKAVIDAYDGSVELYVADEKDPIIAAWRSAFPKSFRPLSEMPADLRAHLRYPELIFRIQTEMFTTYHMRQAQLLFNLEDAWELPSVSTGDHRLPMEPYFTVMKLPGESQPEFIQMLPFTPKGKDNLAAWMVARSDGEHMGELVVYRFPKDRLVFGPQQVVSRINQDAVISRQISLWDQRGSQAVFGTLLVIPIEESLIYVRPLYLRSEGGKLPELKRVIVAYQKQIAMEPSLREAMDAIFGQQPGTPAAGSRPAAAGGKEPAAPSTDLARPGATGRPAPMREVDTRTPRAAQALAHFERAVAAQRAGDWATYGAELQRVEQLLRSLQPAAHDPAPALEAAPLPSEPAPAGAGADGGLIPLR